MTRINDGGPAFPCINSWQANSNGQACNTGYAVTGSQPGMSLLDYFAGQAMQALIQIGAEQIRAVRDREGNTFDSPDTAYYFGNWDGSDKPGEVRGLDELAMDAYTVADALIDERARLMSL